MSMKIKLRLIFKPWSGWTDKQPDSANMEIQVSKGEQLKNENFDGLQGYIDLTKETIEVSDITDSAIEMITSGLVEKNPDGTINLLKESTDTKHHINLGETLRLGTQSMDMGISVEITPLEIIK